jgi:hypothetical protein
MSMPKGFKSKHGYATVSGDDGGMDYRTIAEKMTDSGYKMNHATARNIFLKAMKKLACPVYEIYDTDASDVDIDRTSRDPRFQSGMIEIVSRIYSEENNDEIDV